MEVKTIGLSDHLLTVVVRHYKGENINSGNSNTHISFVYRDLKNLNVKEFVKALNEAPWDTAFIFDETDDIVDARYKIFTNVLDDYAPMMQKRVKKISQPKWFTDDLKNEIQRRDYLLKKAMKTQKADDWSYYKKARNKVNELISMAKRDYFKTKVAESRQNPKKLWNLINNLTKSDVNDQTNIHQLKEGNKLYTDKQEISELLNTFFVTQPQKLLYSILTDIAGISSQVTLYSNLNQKIQFQIPYITADKIQKLLQSMPSCKATGMDGIGVRVLKVAAPSISTSLACLINHCIDNKRFPFTWKSAKVSPFIKDKEVKKT